VLEVCHCCCHVSCSYNGICQRILTVGHNILLHNLCRFVDRFNRLLDHACRSNKPLQVGLSHPLLSWHCSDCTVVLVPLPTDMSESSATLKISQLPLFLLQIACHHSQETVAIITHLYHVRLYTSDHVYMSVLDIWMHEWMHMLQALHNTI